MPWIQLKLNTTGANAEELSDALMEAGSVSITFQDTHDTPVFEPLPGETRLWGDTDVIGLFDAETDMKEVVAILENHPLLGAGFAHKIEQLEDKDWEREWMDNFHPMQFGQRLWICPSWRDVPDENAVNVMLDPGLAFGTGTHPTTSLCLQWLDGLDLEGKTVIDFGCGSGILAIAALKLGAAKAIGIDIDPQAIQASRDNAERNGVSDRLELYLPDAQPEAMKADVVVAVVGESQGMAHEASSRSDITIPESQRDLLKALKATGKPLVLVLMNGRPLALPWENDNADAILETWFSGTEGGNAVADVLFGDYNPSGKLPMTFPRAVGQVPLYYNVLNTGRPFNPNKPDKYTSRYFDITNGPLYPFGYGLSYTQFNVSDITLSSASLTPKGHITASVTVKNTGDRAGATIVQLYLQDVTASLARPVKELKNFKKVMLQPGEQQVVTFPIDETALRFFNQQLKWVSEPGRFNVFIGLDSQDVKKQSFLLTE